MATYNSNNANGRPNGEIEFRLIEQLGVLDTHKSGWAREVNIVSWNGGQPKFDIRDWDPEHERMSRGITLYEREAIKLTKILAQRLQMDDSRDTHGSAFCREQVRERSDGQPELQSGQMQSEPDEYEGMEAAAF